MTKNETIEELYDKYSSPQNINIARVVIESAYQEGYLAGLKEALKIQSK